MPFSPAYSSVLMRHFSQLRVLSDDANLCHVDISQQHNLPVPGESSASALCSQEICAQLWWILKRLSERILLSKCIWFFKDVFSQTMSLCGYVHVSPGALRCPKRALDPPEAGIRGSFGLPSMGTHSWKPNHDIWKSNKCFYLPSHPSSMPNEIFRELYAHSKTEEESQRLPPRCTSYRRRPRYYCSFPNYCLLNRAHVQVLLDCSFQSNFSSM